MKYILDRLSEASTWRGIITFLTGIGVYIQPDLIEYIVAAGMSSAGLAGAIMKDNVDKIKVSL